MATFQRLTSDPAAPGFIPAMLSWVYEAGLPYFDWLLGGDARATIEAWMHRPSSEVFIGRATLLIEESRPLGGYIALSGAELARCRAADGLALAAAAGSERQILRRKMRSARALFAQVEPDELYLSKMGLVAEMRGAGHGRALAHEYLEAGARDGFRRFSLDVSADREGAIHLYRSLGFEQVSEGALPAAGMRYLRLARG